MNKFDVFPKKLTLISLIILGTVFVLLMNMISRNKAVVTSFYTKDVPGLQLYCGASRLIAINQLLETTKSKDVNSMKLNQQGVLYSLNEMSELSSEFKEGANNLASISSVQKFRKTAEENASLATSGDLEVLKTDLQDFIEAYLARKNTLFENQTKLSNYLALLGVGGIVLFFGLIVYVYFIYRRNIIALTQLTAQVEEQRQSSVQASKLASLGEMAAGMAHEINNPLSVITLTSKYMEKLLSKEDVNIAAVKECLVDIDQTVLRISKIITGLRNISRDSSNDPVVPVLIKDIFNDVLGICSERFKNHQVTFTVKDPQNLMEKTLVCQRVQISQVLLNLLGNAFDATLTISEKWICVELSESNKTLRIALSDSGPSIPQDIRNKMFLPFFTTKEIGKGTGLGLSISKSIVEHHGGKLWLDPKTERTQFIIELPLGT